jgi:hypothetical protein
VTGVGLKEGLDWLATMIQNRVPNQRMGQAVRKLDENSNQADLNNLTIRTSMF